MAGSGSEDGGGSGDGGGAGDGGGGSANDAGGNAGADAGSMNDAGGNSGMDAAASMNDAGGVNDAAASMTDAGAGGDAGEDAGTDAGGNPNGSCGWQLTAGGSLFDTANDVLALDDGSVIVVGVSSMSEGGTPFSADGAFAMRVSAEGEIEWASSIPDADAKFVGPGLTSGKVVLAGVARGEEACGNFHGLTDAWIAEVAIDDGEVLGKACIGGDDDDSAVGAAPGSERVIPGGYYQVFGTVDSHDNGNVGPNHNMGTLEATDILIGTWAPAMPSETGGECWGSEGVDGAIALISETEVTTFASSGSTGDLAAYPERTSLDAMFTTIDASDACTDAPCATAVWTGGPGNDNVVAADNGFLVGMTASDTGAVSCNGASLGERRAWIGRFATTDINGLSCLWSGGSITALGVGRGNDTAVLVGQANPIDQQDFADAVVDGENATGNAAYMAIYDDDGLSDPLEIVVVGTLPQVRLTSAAIREDGCIVVVGEAAPGGNSRSDVFVYSRQRPE